MANELFTLEIISPDRVFYKGDVKFVEINTSEGEIGVYKEHIPLTTVLLPGVLRIYEENETKVAALHAGFVQILKDKVTIMAEIAEWPNEIDINRANEAKIRAERRLEGQDDSFNADRAQLALRRSIARIEAINK